MGTAARPPICRPGDGRRSRTYLQKALALRLSGLGDQHATVATTAHSLAKLLGRLMRFDEAENLYKISLSTRRRTSYPPLLAQTLTAYAESVKEKGDNSIAQQLEDEAKRILDFYSLMAHDRT